MFFLADPSFSKKLRTDPEALKEGLVACETALDFFHLGLVEDHLKHTKSAESAFKLSLQRDLQFFPSLYALSLKAFRNFDENSGKSFFRRAIRLDPEAAQNVILFQKELKMKIPRYEEACRYGVWCLKELESSHKNNLETDFYLGKIYFEQSQLEESIPYLNRVLSHAEMGSEAIEYLSYIYEHLFKGPELVEKTLELAKLTPYRVDLFFNLAMVCQNDQKDLELALHFFYLASREEPSDPGLRFSLEQAALELIDRVQGRPKDPNDLFKLMLAHFYQGAVGVARRYAGTLPRMEYPEDFKRRGPEKLWTDWLLKDEGPLGDFLRANFLRPKVISLSQARKA